MEHASLNRRLIASVIDVFIIMIFLSPFSELIAHAFNGVNTEEILQAYIASHSNDAISFNDFVKYMNSHNAIIPYITSQCISFFVTAVYFITFWSYKGATLGKMFLRIKVVNNSTGEKITLKQSIYRFLGYIISTLLLCTGFIMMHFRKDSRGLHDIIASTAVVAENIMNKKNDRI